MDQQHDAPAATTAPTTHRFEFHGSGSEYFRIWIVNLMLSILTLGIYSAWAKVRTQRYLYHGIRLNGSSFDYHGTPLAILKGRIIAVAIIAALNITPNIHPLLYLAVTVVFIVALPWLITKSFAFRMRNSSWRGIRFGFHGTVGQAAQYLYGYGILTAMTLWLAYPLQFSKIREFIGNNTSFGGTRFSLNLPLGSVYGIFVLTGLLASAALIPLVSAMTALAFIGKRGALPQATAFFLIVIVLYLFLIVVVYPFYKAKISNLIWNSTALGGNRLQSQLTAPGYMKIVAVNLLFTLLSLGFYWPWALINIVRYRVTSLSLVAHDDLEQFTAVTSNEVGAAGEEVSSAFDFDISL